MSFDTIGFILISGFTVIVASVVVLSRNIVHSALALILTFLGVAMTFFELGAEFLGLAQVLVYAGAISVLMIFAVMLIMNPDPSMTNTSTPSRETNFWGGVLAWTIVASLGVAIGYSQWPVIPGPASDNDYIGSLANLLMGNYMVAFEAVAILLLLAVVGAIIMAKGAGDS